MGTTEGKWLSGFTSPDPRSSDHSTLLRLLFAYSSTLGRRLQHMIADGKRCRKNRIVRIKSQLTLSFHNMIISYVRVKVCLAT